MSSLEEEREASQVWRHKGGHEVDLLVKSILEREFLDPETAHTLQERELNYILSFARNKVPYYRDHPACSKLALNNGTGSKALRQLPLLSKNDVQDHVGALQAEKLPRGEQRNNLWTLSSGTTGRPTRVRFSGHAMGMFGLLLQRQLRWSRCDPMATQAVIRNTKDLPRREDGTQLADGATYRGPGWMYVGHWFHTGPMIAFSRTNPVELQIDWMREEQPDYLVTYPGTLETLVYACQGSPVDSLKGFRAISAMLTEGMRTMIETATGLPVHQSYGLNEIGLVANRCEAGRYHVNAEHCVVEIVDEDGQPCVAGQTGKLLVTGLTNFAMPLVRYDTGDLAEAVDGLCNCGRTLPSIGRIVGRYRPMRYTPNGTPRRVNLVTDTIERLPLAILAGLRQYQLHQFRDGRFELRLVTTGEPDEVLVEAIREAWDNECDEKTPLAIVRIEEIPLTPSGKQQEFTSDFFPNPDEDTDAPPSSSG